MFTNWGVAAAATVAGITLFAGQPSFSAPPSAPSIEFQIPKPGPAPSNGPAVPSIDPAPPSPGASRPARLPGAPQPPLPRSVNIQMKVERDGRLSVIEQVIVQAKGSMTRVAPLRIGDRVFTVRDATVDGNGTAEATSDTFTIKLGEGASTVKYTVDGAVADLGDHLQFRWQVAGGWDTSLVFLRASLLTPKPGSDFVCLSGKPGTESRCQSVLLDSSGVTRLIQSNLEQGGRVDLSANLAAGLVPATAKFDDGKAGAFALTPITAAALGLLSLLLLAGFGALWVARGRDAKAVATAGEPIDVLVAENDRVVFASPDGVLPGQAGTVVDEVVDGRDLAATVVDLAVRNYLWITEVAGGDWQIVGRNPADESLIAYERAVYAALLPDGVESVLVSALKPDVAAARSAMYADATARGWFARTPGALGMWGKAGAVLAAVGVAATIGLALTIGHALAGVAVLIAGVALVLGERLLPVRSARGGLLVQQVHALVGYLQTATPESVPERDRELVFSRSLPYAVALDQADQWVERFAALDSAADGTPGLYWYGTQDEAFDQPRFAAGFRALVDALSQVLVGG